MSVENIMNTMASQDATESMGSEAISQNAGMPSGSTEAGKPTVRGINDVFNLYDATGDENAAEENGVELKEDKSKIPDELNNEKQKKEEVKEDEKPKEDEAKEDPKEENTKTNDMVKVKVNGVEKEVPLQDVINSYSGQQEIQRRFTEFDKQRKAFEKESTELKSFNEFAQNELKTIKESFDGSIRQYEQSGVLDKNPLEMVNQLLDKMGLNSNTYNRALFEHMLPEYAKFFNMTDIERDAYFAKKENEYLRQKDKAFLERSQQLKTQEEKRAKDLQLIRDHGLDDVKYESFKSELSDAGAKDLTVEQVVEYAKQKPILERVIKISEEAKMDLADQRLPKIKEILSKFPDTTDDEILNVLVPERAAINASKVLQQKQPKTAKIPPQTNEDKELDEQLNFYRR